MHIYGVPAHFACLQSGSAVGGRKCPWEAGFVAIYGVPAHLGCLQSGSAVEARHDNTPPLNISLGM